jgi:hypothetical protein
LDLYFNPLNLFVLLPLVVGQLPPNLSELFGPTLAIQPHR